MQSGGVLSLPVEEIKVDNPPQPGQSGNMDFGRKKDGRGNQIGSYPLAEALENLNKLVMEKYTTTKGEAEAEGKTEDCCSL